MNQEQEQTERKKAWVNVDKRISRTALGKKLTPPVTRQGVAYWVDNNSAPVNRLRDIEEFTGVERHKFLSRLFDGYIRVDHLPDDVLSDLKSRGIIKNQPMNKTDKRKEKALSDNAK